jgi:hypothetical protein
MKLNIIFLVFLMLPAFLLGQENPAQPDTIEITFDEKSPSEFLPYKVPPIRAKEGDWIKLNGKEDHGLIYFIPQSNLLFADSSESLGLVIGRTHFLVLSLSARETIKLKIDENANQGVGPDGKRYPFVIYDKGEWTEGDSSPVIIIEPGVD